jgi:hypothetical protein
MVDGRRMLRRKRNASFVDVSQGLSPYRHGTILSHQQQECLAFREIE